MEIFNGKIEGDYILPHDLCLQGMVTGCLTVPSGKVLDLHGTVCGDLLVAENARVYLRGIVGGNVINRGQLQVFGVIRGHLFKESGTTHVDASAIVDGLS